MAEKVKVDKRGYYSEDKKSASVVDISMGRRAATVRKTHGGLGQSDVTVNFNRDLYKQKDNAEVERGTEAVWKERTSKNSRLYNKSKFRLADYFMNEEGKLEMRIGLTSYKDLCGTNLAAGTVDKYMEQGIKDHNDKYAYIAQALGVGVLLVTSDDHVVIQRRSLWTGEASGMWDRPGGHPEPCDVPQVELPHSVENDRIMNEAILAEIWNSTINEAVDEVGLPRSCLPSSALLLLGLSCGSDRGDRPSLEFFARLPLTSSEVRKSYASGQHAEADESTEILLLPPGDLLTLLQMLKQEYIKRTASQEIKTPIDNKDPKEGRESSTSEETKSSLEKETSEPETLEVEDESNSAEAAKLPKLNIGNDSTGVKAKESRSTQAKKGTPKECNLESNSSEVNKGSSNLSEVDKGRSNSSEVDKGRSKEDNLQSKSTEVSKESSKEDNSTGVSKESSKEDNSADVNKGNSKEGNLTNPEGKVERQLSLEESEQPPLEMSDLENIARNSSPVLIAAILLAEDLISEKKRK